MKISLKFKRFRIKKVETTLLSKKDNLYWKIYRDYLETKKNYTTLLNQYYWQRFCQREENLDYKITKIVLIY